MNFIARTKAAIRRLPQLVLIAATLLAAGCNENREGPTQRVETVEGLRVQKIEMQTVADELEAPGNVITVSTAQVAARTVGTVLQVAVREGDAVARGQVLAQLDAQELLARRKASQAAVQQAKARVLQATKAIDAAQAQADVAQKTYGRYSYLNEQKSVSPQEFDEVAAKLHAAQANLEQAKAALSQAEAGTAQAESEAEAAESAASYAQVVAPFDGRVMRRSVEPGSLISPGMLLFIVEDTSRYQLEATLPAEALAYVKKNGVARVRLDAFPEKFLPGTVLEIEAGADPASHTFKARVDLPPEAGVRSGMFGRAYFVRGEKRVLEAPNEALVSRGQLLGLFAIDDAALIHWRLVTVGARTGPQAEILSGLNDGEVIVLNPGSRDLDGQRAAASPAREEKRP
jgi:multidrug efflux pump subunit AcrA (membrane-fusion protein)